MFGHAVVGVDFSSGGEAVLRSLGNLRVLGTSQLSLVHATNVFDTEVLPVEYRARLKPWTDQLEQEGYDITLDVIPDEPAEGLERIAKERGASFIVVGSRSDSRLRDFFLGSVAWNTVRRASVPVLVERVEPSEGSEDGFEMIAAQPFERILFPTDGSDTANRAFQYVQAAASDGAIHSFALMFVRSQLTETRTGKSTEEVELQRLEELAVQLRAIGAKEVEVTSPSGAPFVEIVRAAERRQGTLIIMGTRGRGLLGDAFLGSVSREVLRQSTGSLLLIPRQLDAT